MRLAIDAVGAKHGGAASVLLSVLGAVQRNDDVEQAVLFCSPARLRRFELQSGGKVYIQEEEYAEVSAVGRLAWHLRGLARGVSRSGANAMLCLSGGGIPPKGLPCAAFVQQPLPFYAEGMAGLSLAQRIRMMALGWDMRLSCSKSALVVVQTTTMKERVASRFGVDERKIAVVEPAHELPSVEGCASPRLAAMREARGARLLYVGSDAGYKNVPMLGPTMRLVRERHPECLLFLTLPREHPLCQGEGMIGLGYLEPAVLAEAYLLSTALVMPSLVETVGLPLLEAASMGKPIMAADRPYARDVCGDTALYFDPRSPRDLAEKVSQVLENETLRARLREKGIKRAASRSASRPYDRLLDLVVGMVGKS